MGIIERREAEKEATKKKIFDGASKLIIENGYEKFSIRKLANEIEYSPAMIYNYFKDKDDIIKAITIENHNIIYRKLLDIDVKSMPSKEALQTGLLTLAQLLINGREHFKATLLSGVNTIDEKSDESSAMTLLISVLNKGVSIGDFEISDTKLTAFLLTTGIFGIVNMIVLNNIYDENMINATINDYIKILVKGVSK